MHQTIAGVRCRVQENMQSAVDDPRVRSIDAQLDNHRGTSGKVAMLLDARRVMVELVLAEHNGRA